jgi:glycine cleavage system aminomethyltransferase T
VDFTKSRPESFIFDIVLAIHDMQIATKRNELFYVGLTGELGLEVVAPSKKVTDVALARLGSPVFML